MPRPALAVSLVALLACHAARPPATGQAPAPGALFLRGNVVRADGTVLPDAVVAVEGNRIARVALASELAVPNGAAVVGGPDRWIVPGLVDAHVHFFQSGGLYTRPDVVDLTARVPYAKEVAGIREALPTTFRRYLRAGVTSVVDFGGRYGTVFRRFPSNRARIAERRTEGDGVVLDHEIVTGRSPDKPDPWDVGWVRYEVEGGLIHRAVLP